MKISQLKTLVKEAVKEAIQEEIKDILLEAVKSPKQPIQEIKSETKPPVDAKTQQQIRENYMSVLGNMMPNAKGEISATTNNMPLQMNGPMDTTSPNGKLPEGNVSMDQIMGLMNK